MSELNHLDISHVAAFNVPGVWCWHPVADRCLIAPRVFEGSCGWCIDKLEPAGDFARCPNCDLYWRARVIPREFIFPSPAEDMVQVLCWRAPGHAAHTERSAIDHQPHVPAQEALFDQARTETPGRPIGASSPQEMGS